MYYTKRIIFMEVYFLRKDVMAITKLSRENIKFKINSYLKNYGIKIGMSLENDNPKSPIVYSYSDIGKLLYTANKPGRSKDDEDKVPSDIDFQEYLKTSHLIIYKKFLDLENKNFKLTLIVNTEK